MLTRLKAAGQALRRDLDAYRLVLRHPLTPRFARWLLALAIGYVFLPFDLVPDFIPVVGQLDDLVVAPLLVFLALRLVPREIVEECRRRAAEGARQIG